jgi:AraC-like DNA-binding protein
LQNVSTFFNLFAGLQSLLLLLFVLLKNDEDSKACRFLIGTILLFHALLYFDLASELFGTNFPSLSYIGTTTNIFCPGLLYYYIRLKIDPNYRFRPIEALHLLPFILTFAAFYWQYWTVTSSQQLSDQYLSSTVMASSWFATFVPTALLLQLSIAFNLVRKHHTTIVNLRADLDGVSLRWLVYLIISFVGIWLIFLPELCLRIFAIQVPQASLSFSILQGVFGYGTATFLIFYGVFSQGKFGARAALDADELALERDLESLKQCEGGRDNNDYEVQFSIIESKLPELMEDRKIFLDANLTLLKMAKLCGLPTKYLSKYFNTKLGLNFNEYMNGQRINAAKQMLLEKPEMAVIDVMYESGFNSKSVFNTRFKQIVGVTPTEFRS